MRAAIALPLVCSLSLCGCGHMAELASAAQRGTHMLDAAANAACVAEPHPDCAEALTALDQAREAVDAAAKAAKKLEK